MCRFCNNGLGIVTKDLYTVKVWDISAPTNSHNPKSHNGHNGHSGPRSPGKSEPVINIPIHGSLTSHLSNLCESDAMGDKFTLDISPDGTQVIVGSYANQFNVFHLQTGELMNHCDLNSAKNSRESYTRNGGDLANAEVELHKKVFDLNVYVCVA